jgi:hypothetical protein
MDANGPGQEPGEVREPDEALQGDHAAGAGAAPGRRRPTAAAVILFILVILLSTTQSLWIDTDQVILRAAIAERAHPMTGADRVHVRFTPTGLGIAKPFKPFSIVQGAAVSGAAGVAAEVAAGVAARSEVPSALARLLAAYPFAWDQPLSVKRFVAWRTAHACCKQDWLETRTRDGLLVLRTIVSDGELREVDLTIDAETYRVVAETLVFRDVGRLEIEDLAHATALNHATPSYTTPRTSPIVPAAPRANRDELNRAELKLRLVPRGPTSGLDHWVTRTFGDHATRASFVPDLTHAIDAVRHRLEVLAAFEQRDPAAPAPARPIALHYEKLRGELDELRKRIAVLAGTPNALVLAVPDPPADLVARASAALPHATALEEQVQTLLTHKDVTPPEQDRVRARFEALWQSVHGPRPSRR